MELILIRAVDEMMSVTVNEGDTINFNLSNIVDSVHPFYIRNAAGNTNVSSPTATNQSGTGNVTVSWTPTYSEHTHMFIGNHSSMKGTILVIIYRT